MAFEQRPGQINLFENNRKTNDRQPDYRPIRDAYCEVEVNPTRPGKQVVKLDIAGWRKVTQKGNAMLFLMIKVVGGAAVDGDMTDAGMGDENIDF